MKQISDLGKTTKIEKDNNVLKIMLNDLQKEMNVVKKENKELKKLKKLEEQNQEIAIRDETIETLNERVKSIEKENV